MNQDKILGKFSDKIQKNFDLVVLELKNSDGMASKELEEKIATFILSLIESTSSDENSIMKTSYLIANSFKDYNFDERIQRAIDIFCELQIPVDFQEGRQFVLWDKAKDYLLKYLEDEELIVDTDDDDLDLDWD